MDVAVTHVTEGDDADAVIDSTQCGAGIGDELRHAADRHGHVVLDADAFGFLRFGDVLAQFPPAFGVFCVVGDIESDDAIECLQGIAQSFIQRDRQYVAQLRDDQPFVFRCERLVGVVDMLEHQVETGTRDDFKAADGVAASGAQMRQQGDCCGRISHRDAGGRRCARTRE